MLLLLAAFAVAVPVGEGAADEPPPAGARWQARRAEYRLTRLADGTFMVDGRLELGALAPEPAVVPWLRSTGEDVAIEATGGAASLSGGLVEVVLPRDTDHAVATLRARVTPAEASFRLPLAAVAPLQTVAVDAPGWDVTVAEAHDGVFRGDVLSVRWAPHHDAAPVSDAPLVLAEVAAAAWGWDGAVGARARVRWKVLRGEVGTFRLDVGGLEDVELTGPNVATWSRAGNTVTVVARGPVRGGFAVEVQGHRSAPTGDFPFPAPVPLDVRRVDRWWTLGRADEGELLPQSAPEGVPQRALPEWARGLSDTTPLASWHGATPVTLRSARYEAVAGPDTVVEDARFVVATNADGRVVLRATWWVRNERSQYLHVAPPPGWSPLTARVTGDPVTVLADGAGGVYVPLEKSIETLRGLLAFPVEVTWIADEGAWARRGARTFTLPAVDAPIQSASWEVHLPRGLQVRGPDAPTRGPRGLLSFGRPDTPPAEPTPIVPDVVDAALSNATRAYQDNDFRAAQEWVDTARAAEPENENVDRLQSNLDVLLGGKGGEDSGTRRVLDLANAKTLDVQNDQAKAEAKADELLRSGDEAEALRYLEEAEKLSEAVAITEQRESVEQKDKAEDYKRKAEVAKKALLGKEAAAPPKVQTKAASGSSSSATGSFSPAEDGEATWHEADVVFGGVDDADEDTVGMTVDGVPVPDEVPAPPVTATSSSSEAGVVPTVDTGRSYQSTTVAVERPAPRQNAPARGEHGATRAPEPVAARAAPAPAAAAAPAPAAPGPAFAGHKAPAPAPPPPPPPTGRPSLDVRASPLTPALPLGTPAVFTSQALLGRGQRPTFTLRYRTIPGET